ncbi:LysR family transcriptional regulator [Leucobacter sp. HY1910]
MPLPSIRQLEYFTSAARVGTFAGAAAENHIAQPSLSEQISNLEQGLEVSLFTRTSRGLQLTDAGKQLLPLAEEALRSMKEFAEWSRRLRSIEVGMVSFGTFSSAHLYLLTDLIKEFRTLHPSVRVHVTGLNSSEVADGVRSGELEAGLIQLPVDDRDLEVSPAIFADQVIYISKDPLPNPSGMSVADMQGRPLILAESSWALRDPLRISLLERAQREGRRLEPVIEVEFSTHAAQLAAEGLGDAFASYHVVRSLLEKENLHWAPLDPPHYERHAFITKKGGAISPATAEFMRIAHRLMQRLAALSPLQDPSF